jgi:putrescine transport system substrate-binding protein
VKVNYEVMDSNELLETKLLAGRTGYDVVVPSASFLARQIKSGIYQKLDKARLTNYKNLDADLSMKQQVFDPGNEYGVNYMWGTSGVAYNEGKVKEVMPDAPVDSFAMFWDPKVVSKFAKCGVSVLDAPSEIIGTVLIYLGKDGENPEPKAAEACPDGRTPASLINSSSTSRTWQWPRSPGPGLVGRHAAGA